MWPHELIEKIFPAAKAHDAQTGPGGGKTNSRFEDDDSIGTTELRETPGCRDGTHGSSDRRRLRSTGLTKTVLQAETELMFSRTTNCSGYSRPVRTFIRFGDADDGDGHHRADGNFCEMGVCQR